MLKIDPGIPILDNFILDFTHILPKYQCFSHIQSLEILEPRRVGKHYINKVGVYFYIIRMVGDGKNPNNGTASPHCVSYS